MYNLPAESNHLGILKKYEFLKNKTFIGQKEIKGIRGSGQYLLSDAFVSESHMLHDLIRGFYKPKGKPYIQSYLATESIDNYGKQIQWKDNTEQDFKLIRISPPNGEKDNRAKSDIKAARYNLKQKVPIGIFHKVKKGVNRCLGLGLIIEETEKGIFLVCPISLEEYENEQLNSLSEELNNLAGVGQTETEAIIKARIGQSQFKNALLKTFPKCKICGLDIKDLLIASHIKPWRESNNEERLDINNGFLLCPVHDRLFDRGFISFDPLGNILISNLIKEESYRLLNINNHIKIDVTRSIDYLEWHRTNSFIGTFNF